MSPPKIRGPLTAAALGLIALGLVTRPADAEPAPPFADLLSRSLSTAPRLAEARAEVARAEGLARQARAYPNPTVGVQVENFSGSGPYQGVGMAESTASVQQPLELGGKRATRIAAGRAEVEAARARARSLEAGFAFDLAAAYAEAEATQRRLQLAEEVLSLADDDARIATALVNAGKEADLRRLQARAAVQAARAAVDEARTARTTAFANLTALAGEPAPITSIQTSLLDRPAPLAAVAPAATATPAYLAAEAEREAAARRLRAEGRRAIPDVTVSVGVRRFEADRSTALIAGVSVPFPIFDRNRGNIDAARAEVSAADARLNAARLEAEGALRASAARVTAAESRIAAAQEGETTAQEAYRLARLGYEAGRLPLVELVNARRALAEARTQTIAAAVERVGATAALARRSGRAADGVAQ